MNAYTAGVQRLAQASAVHGCAVVVGGKLGAGGRVCGHDEAVHSGSYATGDALCLGCAREGVTMHYQGGLEQSYAGRDHQFAEPADPRERRAAMPELREAA